jgi:hypothetical protein
LSTHEQYEELCALAVSGQASPAQLTELRSHLEDCPACHSAAYDFTQISAQGLAQIAAKRLRHEIPIGMTERFVARARSEGIEIGRESLKPPSRPKSVGILAYVCALAALILVAAFLLIARFRTVPSARTARPEVAPASNGVVAATPIHGSSGDDGQLEKQLGSAQTEIASLEATIQNQRNELQASKNMQTSLTSELAGVTQDAARIRDQNAQLNAQIAELDRNLVQAKSEKSTSDAVVAVEESEMRDLRNKLAEQQAVLSQEEELAARGSDVRDLVVARNLHIIDVHDRDGNGKSQRAFGRIFYTEGKSLIFYAYDLADPRKLDAKVSFYVWGESLGAEKPIRSLGVFHNDDASDGRWVLTFDDPRVLARINSVFVTVESAHKAVKEPAGKRILFAFLGDKPNHP